MPQSNLHLVVLSLLRPPFAWGGDRPMGSQLNLKCWTLKTVFLLALATADISKAHNWQCAMSYAGTTSTAAANLGIWPTFAWEGIDKQGGGRHKSYTHTREITAINQVILKKHMIVYSLPGRGTNLLVIWTYTVMSLLEAPSLIEASLKWVCTLSRNSSTPTK